MDNVFKHLKRKSKQIISFMLVFCILTENPLSVYASTKATSSNIQKPVVDYEETSSLDNIDTGDFNPDTYDGVPFYFDEHGNRIYDDVDNDYNEYADYVKPEYLDIASTFEDYPLTTIDYTVDDIAPYIAGIDDAALVVLAAALASCGAYVAFNNLQDFSSNCFEPWVRRTYGSDQIHMKLLQAWLGAKAGEAFEGMQNFRNMVGNFLDSATWNGNSASFNVSATSPMIGSPYSWFSQSTYKAYPFIGSYSFNSRPDIEKQVCVVSEFDFSNKPYVFYNSSSSSSSVVSSVIANVLGVTGYAANGQARTTSGFLFGCYKEYNTSYGYYPSTAIYLLGDKSKAASLPLDFVSQLGKVFINKAAAESYLTYGTTGGLLASGSSTDTISHTVSFKKTWGSLRTNYRTAYEPSNTLTLPATSSALTNLLDNIYAADTEKEVISAINPVWQHTKNTSLTPTLAYSSLSYVLAALASSSGVTLTGDLIDEFIVSFYGDYVDGTSALKEEQAEDIMNKFAVMEGGGDNGEPDNNNDNNKYKIALKLAIAFGSFMLTKGFIEELPNFKENTVVTDNISIYSPETAPTPNPDPEPDPDPNPEPNPDPNPNPNPDTGTGLIKVVQDIYAAIIALPDKLVLGFSQPLTSITQAISALPNQIATSIGSIKLFQELLPAIEALPDKLVSGLALPRLFSDVLQSLDALPGKIAQQIGDINLFKDMLHVIELLPDKLVLGFALPDLFAGITNIVGALPGAITELLPGVLTATLPGILADALGLIEPFSLPDALKAIKEALAALPKSIAESLKDVFDGGNSDTSQDETDDGSGLFENILDILMLIILIIIALLILFLNCLKFIFNLYQIPASTDLFNENVLKGLQFLKSVNIPFPGTSGIGLFELLMACAYFVLFTTVIATLRRKIDKFHV